jgi:adenylate kinase family enzyme
MKILISGIPGTGKTFIGEYLREKKGFRHIDMESGALFQELKISPENFINSQLSGKEDIVVTGGFMISDLAFALVKMIISKGFVFVWFDGNREVAKEAFIKRNTVAVKLFDAKMGELAGNYSKIMALHPLLVNSFDEASKFRKPAEIVKEIEDKLILRHI